MAPPTENSPADDGNNETPAHEGSSGLAPWIRAMSPEESQWRIDNIAAMMQHNDPMISGCMIGLFVEIVDSTARMWPHMMELVAMADPESLGTGLQHIRDVVPRALGMIEAVRRSGRVITEAEEQAIQRLIDAMQADQATFRAVMQFLNRLHGDSSVEGWSNAYIEFVDTVFVNPFSSDHDSEPEEDPAPAN